MSSSQPRQPAKRVLAREFNDSKTTYKKGDEEKSPRFQLLRSGDEANRVALVGTLTDTEDVGGDGPYWKGNIVDPAGDTFFTYAGEYQSDCMAFLRNADTPMYVVVIGKPKTYENDEGDTYVKVSPEEIKEIDEETRNMWALAIARDTMSRLDDFETARNSEEAEMSGPMARAIEEYGSGIATYRNAAEEALESLADPTEA